MAKSKLSVIYSSGWMLWKPWKYVCR